MLFAKAILAGEPINVFNEGRMKRDFTFVEDIVTGLIAILDRPATPDPSWNSADPNACTSSAPWRIYNIGHHEPVELLDFINVLETALGKKANLNMLPMQPGDVVQTYADIERLQTEFGFHPTTSLEDGIRQFVDWYRDYYRS
jgi:UDP-glucuronate 4-epimerase